MILKRGSEICESVGGKYLNCKPKNSGVMRCNSTSRVSIYESISLQAAGRISLHIVSSPQITQNKSNKANIIYFNITNNNSWPNDIYLRAIARFTVIDENELVQYSGIQNRDQILKRLFPGILQNDSQESTCGGVLL